MSLKKIANKPAVKLVALLALNVGVVVAAQMIVSKAGEKIVED